VAAIKLREISAQAGAGCLFLFRPARRKSIRFADHGVLPVDAVDAAFSPGVHVTAPLQWGVREA